MIIIILVCNVLSTYSFVLPETFNLMIKKNADYKVDMLVNEDDYEMIGSQQLKQFKVDDQQFIELDEMAVKDYNNRTSLLLNVILVDSKLESSTQTSPISEITSNNKTKTVETTESALHTTHANKKREIVNENEMEYEYVYNDLLHEYHEQGNNETGDQDSVTEIQEYGLVNSFKRIFLPQQENDNCNKSIGLQALQCLLSDYRNQRRPTKEVTARLVKIAQIWFIVYLVVAIPLWCTRGWCCCCLFCKFFKPRQTIDEAKKYLILNPPGIFKTKNGEVRYDPTEREKETYEEFEHFIKTL